jgi:uncharacterized small protein (DUF1192 family)
MFDEEMLPKKKKTAEFPRNLVDMSIAELEEYISEMKGEIARVEGDIAKPQIDTDKH